MDSSYLAILDGKVQTLNWGSSVQLSLSESAVDYMPLMYIDLSLHILYTYYFNSRDLLRHNLINELPQNNTPCPQRLVRCSGAHMFLCSSATSVIPACLRNEHDISYIPHSYHMLEYINNIKFISNRTRHLYYAYSGIAPHKLWYNLWLPQEAALISCIACTVV